MKKIIRYQGRDIDEETLFILSKGKNPLTDMDELMIAKIWEKDKVKEKYTKKEASSIAIKLILIIAVIGIIVFGISARDSFNITGGVINAESYMSRYGTIYYVLLVKSNNTVVSLQVDESIYGKYVGKPLPNDISIVCTKSRFFSSIPSNIDYKCVQG